jgi:hypothetical protein
MVVKGSRGPFPNPTVGTLAVVSFQTHGTSVKPKMIRYKNENLNHDLTVWDANA